MAEPIEMTFGVLTRVGTRNHVLQWQWCYRGSRCGSGWDTFVDSAFLSGFMAACGFETTAGADDWFVEVEADLPANDAQDIGFWAGTKQDICITQQLNSIVEWALTFMIILPFMTAETPLWKNATWPDFSSGGSRGRRLGQLPRAPRKGGTKQERRRAKIMQICITKNVRAQSGNHVQFTSNVLGRRKPKWLTTTSVTPGEGNKMARFTVW